MLPAESSATPFMPLRLVARLMTETLPQAADGSRPSQVSSALCRPARFGVKVTATEQSAPGSIVALQFCDTLNEAASGPLTVKLGRANPWAPTFRSTTELPAETAAPVTDKDSPPLTLARRAPKALRTKTLMPLFAFLKPV